MQGESFIRILFIPDGCMTRGEIRKFDNLQIAPDDLLDCKWAAVQP